MKPKFNTLADMIDSFESYDTIKIEESVVTPVYGSNVMYQANPNWTTEVYSDLRDWAEQLQFDASEYLIADDADGNTYDQCGLTIFRDPDDYLFGVKMTKRKLRNNCQ